MFHAPIGRFQLELIYYFTYFSTVVPSNNCVCFFCRLFVVNMTKGLQDRNTQLLDGTMVENNKLILIQDYTYNFFLNLRFLPVSLLIESLFCIQIVAREKTGNAASAPLSLVVSLNDVNDNAPRLPMIPPITIQAGESKQSVTKVSNYISFFFQLYGLTIKQFTN